MNYSIDTKDFHCNFWVRVSLCGTKGEKPSVFFLGGGGCGTGGARDGT